jgi:DNA-binding response OmpR family regulator
MNAQLTDPTKIPSSPAFGPRGISWAAEAGVPQVAAGDSRLRILYVDDDRSLRSLGEQVLQRAGYEVDTAGDGAQAWSALHDEIYDLLITDNQMPRLTGLELIRRMRQEHLGLPVILASGTVDLLRADELARLECGATLAKPFTLDQLLSAVQGVLRTEVRLMSPCRGRVPTMEEFHVNSHASIQPHLSWGINE